MWTLVLNLKLLKSRYIQPRYAYSKVSGLLVGVVNQALVCGVVGAVVEDQLVVVVERFIAVFVCNDPRGEVAKLGCREDVFFNVNA